MKLIESSVDIINIDNPFIKIEKVGRTCYKSTSEMTEETSKKFFKNLVSRNHTAMLEHAVFVFQVTERIYHNLQGHKYFNYSVEELAGGYERFLVSANLRAINESEEGLLLSVLHHIDPDLVYNEDFYDQYISEDYCKVVDIDSIPDIQEHAYKAHKHLTFHFICDRGVSHEIVRHRPASYAQESTRYCNYSKDKFGSEITCIKPANYSEWSDIVKFHFCNALEESERYYFDMLNNGHTPQEARAVLPNALKTEIIMTANCEEFNHFFDLRRRGTTGSPHPDMKKVADEAFVLYMRSTKLSI